MFRKGIAFALVFISLTALMCHDALASEEKIGYVTSTGLYIRRSPNTSAEALRCATNGEQLIILREEGDWYYVQYNEVVSGYVAKKYVSLKKPSGTSAGVSTTTETLPSRVSELGKAPASSKLGDRGNDVLKLQQALKITGYFSGSCDGIFGDQTEEAVKKFQKARGLSRDGVAGKVTIKLLFGEDAADEGSKVASTETTKTEKLEWFSAGNQSIPRGATFTIKDVRSGRTFKARRLFGDNHLDAEPVDKAATGVLKEIYGGNFSWSRRPILISYNGRILAASMNGMPHGEQSIYNNGFDGQFCIHFQGSMTHGSLKVDPDHQACVNEAAKAKW